MTTIEMTPYIPQAVISDIKTAMSQIRHGKARLIRLPVFLFAEAVNKILKSNPYAPFRPVLFGLPVDQTEHESPEVVCVHDDDTNAAQTVKTELEV